ncbi:MAG: dTDP-4-dehydrorhamnose 3,5-epimerase [Candidatus Methylomirabilales bacterium]
MIFTETRLPGAFLVQPEPRVDERGFFARTWCSREFAARGLNPRLAQCSISFTRARGTVRGMHYQAPPHEEAKLVRCTAGAIYDVVIDLRPGSPTFRQWLGVELSAAGRTMLYIPEGVAHGFQTLEDGVEVSYQMGQCHAPASARGVRFDDPAFGIRWPLPVTAVSPRDRSWPLVEAAGPAAGHAVRP